MPDKQSEQSHVILLIINLFMTIFLLKIHVS